MKVPFIPQKIPAREIACGECSIFDGEFYIHCHGDEGGWCLINLRTGDKRFREAGMMVMPVELEAIMVAPEEHDNEEE